MRTAENVRFPTTPHTSIKHLKTIDNIDKSQVLLSSLLNTIHVSSVIRKLQFLKKIVIPSLNICYLMKGGRERLLLCSLKANFSFLISNQQMGLTNHIKMKYTARMGRKCLKIQMVLIYRRRNWQELVYILIPHTM